MLNYTAVRCCTTELVAELSPSFRSVPSELKCQGTSVVYSMRALGHKSNCSRCCLLERSCISSRGGAGKTSPFRWVASHFLKAIPTRPPHHLTTSYNILQPSKDHNANPHYVILCLHLDICSTRLFFIRIQTFSRASWPRSKRDSLAQTDLQIKLKQEGSQKVRGMITGESSRKKTAWAKWSQNEGRRIKTCRFKHFRPGMSCLACFLSHSYAWNLSRSVDALVQHQPFRACVAPESGQSLKSPTSVLGQLGVLYLLVHSLIHNENDIMWQ